MSEHVIWNYVQAVSCHVNTSSKNKGLKCYWGFSSLASPTFSATFWFGLVWISYRIISQYRKLTLDQVNVDRNMQGCWFPLIPYILCLDSFSRRKEISCESENSAVTEAILVLCGHIPYATALLTIGTSSQKRRQGKVRKYPLLAKSPFAVQRLTVLKIHTEDYQQN